jgi:hypothetical protein
LDERKKKLASKKFTPDRGPLSEETREKLRQRMKEWNLKTRRGTDIGNALAKKARRSKGLGVWLTSYLSQLVLDALPLVW